MTERWAVPGQPLPEVPESAYPPEAIPLDEPFYGKPLILIGANLPVAQKYAQERGWHPDWIRWTTDHRRLRGLLGPGSFLVLHVDERFAPQYYQRLNDMRLTLVTSGYTELS